MSSQICDNWSQKVFFAQMTSYTIHYDVIYPPFPINSWYLKTWGIDSPAQGLGICQPWAHAPLGFSQAHGFWLELQTEKKISSLAFWQGLTFFFNSEIKSGQCESSTYFLVTAHKNAASNPTPLCNGWELLQYTVLIGVIQGLEHSPPTFCHHRRVHCTCIWLFKCP